MRKPGPFASRRYPWPPMERTEIPFSAVYSIGFKDTSGDGPPVYDAFLRLKGWREITLWQLARPTGPNPTLESYISNDRNLTTLSQLTGLKLENRQA
jgi:hypothetical protein